jgi:dTDP-4-dehydrorhamnose reductase
VSDQWSSPTLASDLAPKLREIAIAGRAQLYHIVNPGPASYLDVAREAARLLGLDPQSVRPVESASLSRPAPRPRFSALASLALPAEGIAPLRPWQEALADYVRSLSPAPA